MDMQARNAPFERTRSCYLHQMGEITTYWYGKIMLGVRTSDGCFRVNPQCWFGREQKLVKKKQKAFGMNTWGAGHNPKKLCEIAGTAMMREFGTYARARMAGEA